MSFLGVYALNDLCTFYANTHTPSTGGEVDADAAPGYRVYEEETTAPILTGAMALLDATNTTGFYSEQLTLSAANGFELGKSYCIRITMVVGGVTGVLLYTLQMRVQQTGDAYAVVTSRLPAALVSGRMDSHVGSIADALLTAAKFAAGAFDAVWTVAARLLTAGTNIVLAKGTGVTGFNDVSTAQVNAEVDTALVDVGLSTTVTGRLDAAVSTRASQASVDALPSTGHVDSNTEEVLLAIGALNDVSAAQVNAEVDTALADVGLTTTVTGRLDAAVSSRASQTSVDALPSTSDLAASDDAVLAAIAALYDLDAAGAQAAAEAALLAYNAAQPGDIMALTSPERDAIADAYLDRVDAVEAGLTPRGALRLGAAADAGTVSGMGTATVTIHNAVADSKTRITGTVDESGNRSAVTVDVTD